MGTANQGHYRSQAALANAHLHETFVEATFLRQVIIDCRSGCGVPNDPPVAYYWLLLARAGAPATLQQFHAGLIPWIARVEGPADTRAAGRGPAAGRRLEAVTVGMHSAAAQVARPPVP